MSPYHDCFINFKSIPLCVIEAADKHTFNTIGRGDLSIEISNGKTKTRILLMKILYAPSMRAAFISISRLTYTGYTAIFRGDLCQI
ncbi:hypothetical protein BD769DRAFT_1303147, partial [Suillus cothurnatus]